MVELLLAKRSVPLVCVLLLTGCGDERGHGGDGVESGGTDTDGGSETGEPEGDEDDEGSGGPGAEHCQDGGLQPGTAPLRRLTHWEYDNTVRDLLGDDRRLAAAFATDSAATGFDNQANNLGVGPALAEEYMLAAETLAADAVVNLDELVACQAGRGEAACGHDFIDRFGARAFRRPMTNNERVRMRGLFDAIHNDYGFERAIELVVSAMLQSPNFLYRVEVGMPEPTEDGVVALTDYELATRLSYLLWGSMPDESLMTAAAEGRLQSAEEIEQEALRLLDDPRAREAVANFHRQWLSLDELESTNKDSSVYPEWSDGFKAAAEQESLAFLEHVVFDGEGDLDTMFLASYTFADQALAEFYGVASSSGSQFERIELDPAERTGILTHASVLATTGKPNQTSPVLRGAYVRAALMCQHLPEPPPGVDTTPPEVSADATTRERFDQHTADPSCAGCHVLIDPIGFGFEHYDSVGRWRDTDAGMPVDASGEIVGIEGGDATFDGVPELAVALADSPEVRECFVDQWFAYAHGRSADEADDCTQQTLRSAFVDADRDVRSLLVALTQTDAFRYRPAAGGQ